MEDKSKKMFEIIGNLYFENTEKEALNIELNAEYESLSKSMNQCIKENNKLIEELNLYQNLRPNRAVN